MNAKPLLDVMYILLVFQMHRFFHIFMIAGREYMRLQIARHKCHMDVTAIDYSMLVLNGKFQYKFSL